MRLDWFCGGLPIPRVPMLTKEARACPSIIEARNAMAQVNHSEARTYRIQMWRRAVFAARQGLDLVSCVFHACFHASMLPPYSQPPITMHTPGSCTANRPPLNLSLVANTDTVSVAPPQVFQVLTFALCVRHPWTSKSNWISAGPTMRRGWRARGRRPPVLTLLLAYVR